MANYYKHILQLKGDPSQLPLLQDAINDKVASLIADHALEPDSLEFNRPENLDVSFVTRRMRDDLQALVLSLIGPDNRSPDVWMDAEITDLEEMNDYIDFANEDLAQVQHYISSGGTWRKYRNTQEKREALTEAETLLKSAQYAACHERWNLHRELLEEARDLLHDHWPSLFSKHPTDQTDQTSNDERAA